MNRCPMLAIAIAFTALTNSEVVSQTPNLVRDINAIGQLSGSRPSTPVRAGNRWFFTAEDATHGVELWVTDGTRAGTTLVLDINPGEPDSLPGSLTALGDKMFFSAESRTHGRELWITDGTRAGTRLVKDIAAGAKSANPVHLSAFGSKILFAAGDSNSSSDELWISDGTTHGTKLVRSKLLRAHNFFELRPGTAVFTASDGLDAGLWVTDGSGNGTKFLKSITPQQDGRATSYRRVAGRAMFSAYEKATGQELWTTDGTKSGTVLVKDIQAGNKNGRVSLTESVVYRGELFFAASGDNGFPSLWKTSGTAASTVRVYDVSPFGFQVHNNRLFIVGSTPSGPSGQLWVTDGTRRGTRRAFGNTVEYWNLGATASFGGSLFFSAKTTTQDGRELFRSDGTRAGTHLVRDLYVGRQGSEPRDLTEINGKLVFGAVSGPKTGAGDELYVTDGTTNGTSVLRDIWPGFVTFDARVQYLVDHFGTLYFQANDGIHGPELWKSDGTRAGTRLVRDIWPGSNGSAPSDLISFQGVVYFAASTKETGRELWKTDGTVRGTVLVQDIYRGASSSNPRGLTAFGTRLHFGAWPGIGGRALMSTDCTPRGAKAVKSLPYWTSSDPHDLVVYHRKLFFAAAGQLWRSDGTNAGTTLIRATQPGAWLAGPSDITLFRGRLYFSAWDAWGPHGHELWVSDGTSAGTRLFRDLARGSASSKPRALLASENYVFFEADAGQGTGRELYRTNGNPANTVIVADVAPGAAHSNPRPRAAIGRHVVFAATTPTLGRQLYVTDGSTTGTKLLAPITPGVGWGASFGGSSVFVSNRFMFGAYHPEFGAGELFSLETQFARAHSFGDACGPSFPNVAATTPLLGSTCVLTGSGPNNHPGFLFLSLPRPPAVVAGCFDFVGILTAPPIAALTSNSYSHRIDIPNLAPLVGLSVNLQSWFFTPQTFFPLQTSNGLQLTLGR